MKNRQGFATIYIVLILFSLVFFILVISEEASIYASKSISENITYLAGRSVLSYYQRNLYERYGIFALNSFTENLEDIASFYIEENLNSTNKVVNLKLSDISISLNSFRSLDIDKLREKIVKLSMKNFLHQSSSEDANYAKLPNLSLASHLLGYSSRFSILFSGGIADLNVNTALEDEYILAVCSNQMNRRSDTYLALETEYILFGYSSDEENMNALRRSLIALRTSINLVKILADEKEMAKLSAIAVATMPELPLPAALGILTGAEAANKAADDVDSILNGDDVDGISYEGYLRILLTLLSSNEKIARLMDIMEINIQLVDKADFAFSDYCFGFELNTTIEKRNNLMSIGPFKRTHEITQVFEYK